MCAIHAVNIILAMPAKYVTHGARVIRDKHVKYVIRLRELCLLTHVRYVMQLVRVVLHVIHARLYISTCAAPYIG